LIRRFVQFFAARSAVTLLLWAALLIFGFLSYFSLLPREGFPAVDAPIALGSGSWFVDDAEMIDAEIAQPVAAIVSESKIVKGVSTVARENSFTLVAELEEGESSIVGADIVAAAFAASDIPPDADVTALPIEVAKFFDEFDLLVGVVGPDGASAQDLEAAAKSIEPFITEHPDLVRAEVLNLIDRGVNPTTGEEVALETGFNELTSGPVGDLRLRSSVAVGVVAADGIDALATRDGADAAVAAALAAGAVPDGFDAIVALDQATQIRNQISSLQSNVITGIIAVAIVALLLISWRASIITALFILTVMATTFGVLFVLGISLNTISLFGVIIALGLFVDDSIVITEAIDAFREGKGDHLAIIGHAIDRVGAASISGTITTVLVFAPMLAISGILGSFIRILPISVITALIVSLLLSLVFIPFAARFLVLPAPPSNGPLARLTDRLATAVASAPAVRGGKGVALAAAGVLISVVMTFVGIAVFAPKVGFNIFPPQKDSQYAQVDINFAPDTTIDEARTITAKLNETAIEALGDDVEQVYTYFGGTRSAFSQYRLSDIGSRTVAPRLVEEVLQPLADQIEGGRAVFSMLSAGPPELLFPFQMQLFGDDQDTLLAAAQTIAARLESAEIARPNDMAFRVLETELGLVDTVSRQDGRRYVEVRARFDADDITTLTAETQTFIEDSFGADDLAALGLESDALGFDFGFESDNQESFESMPRAFGVALLLMLVLLIIQFRSAVQWFLVFLAIPFSFFGVFGGLLLTDNQISFFVMLGLLGLIGIAVNNTILLTDFANQERRAGADRKTAIETAMRRRFRPLVATSLTTVAGVLPLALSDPFWESLGFTIIFGLLSSTFLVLVSFPYYYLAIEWCRDGAKALFRRMRGRPAIAS